MPNETPAAALGQIFEMAQKWIVPKGSMLEHSTVVYV